MGTLLSFPVERAVFIREYYSRLYGVEEYFVAKNLIETPFTMFFAALFSLISYYTVGLRPEAKHYFIFVAIITLFASSA